MTRFLRVLWHRWQFGDSSEDAADVERNNPKCFRGCSWGE